MVANAGTGDGAGTLAVWRNADGLTPELAVELEKLGYGRIWIGGSPDGDLAAAERLLDATSTIGLATGIVNIWKDDAKTVAASYQRLQERHPGRFLLGIGAGHREFTGERYVRPYEALVSYLDVLDAEGVPQDRRVLAALGPRVLRLAADRAGGAHPYLVTPEHTRTAREILGPDALLAPEQKVVLEADPVRARAIGRPRVEKPYLSLANYTSNLRRFGWSDQDLAGGGSDRLIDALAPHGTPEQAADALRAHLRAGADEVVVQLLTEDGELPEVGYRQLAEALQG
ncbi:LLM class F420-dependent oxidoreductase [Streptacidiphilus sp. P02-A3a]|uniref:LLM class F420-dependent oxidoreductase n=1 Tax=Streptacidiphilus sp. P02-A3a TaxID=2704468 RepID=UPI0015FC4F68|nr:LLM class F420-dependent oxidoreductase [Streptacidiphilus sp. P02-A3a]QMU70128.1 LLM class F420-dependent oxidoreductase [Streptacidiphilus sp. P02-A3a]QMU70424.1 LLM class F420-dependent oxidoreductase [Streptacidiphilus sp. P02-A3a]